MTWLSYYKTYKMHFWCIKATISLPVTTSSIYEKNDKTVTNMSYSVKVFLYMVTMVSTIHYFKFWRTLAAILGIHNIKIYSSPE